MLVKRVNINRVNNRFPERTPYPFMVDERWFTELVEDKNLEERFTMMDQDPPGMGSNVRRDED